jgi:hypothetical protein
MSRHHAHGPYCFLPDKAYLRELYRPWKLLSFIIAMGLLLYGALNFDIADWDIGVTLIMGGLTYLMAPWSVHIILSAIRYRPHLWYLQIIAALAAGLFVVDWVYMLYHSLMENQTYRDANFNASAPLFFLAGTVGLFRGSLVELIANIWVITRPGTREQGGDQP